MIKKIILIWIIFCLIVPLAKSAEADWVSVYRQVKDAYVDNISIENMAIAAMKGIHEVDKNLVLANDGQRVSLYYRGKVVKVLRKPEDKNDAASWGKITENIITAATNVSEKAAEQDFRLEDIFAAGIINVLDSDSKFYQNMDDAYSMGRRPRRVFAARQDGDILLVKIGVFNKQTVAEVKAALHNFESVSAIVIDLRGCSGGMLSAAIETADLFLDGGIIASFRGKETGVETYYNAATNENTERRPLFVLTDATTASAAEILTAALQEQGRAKVIGTLSHGKGTMQKLIRLSSGSVIAVTNGFFMTPSGRDLNKNGVMPDICTFESGESSDIDALLSRNHQSCAKEEREDSNLELKIVERLL